MSAQPQPVSPLQRLPLVTLYLTERCNSRCVTCDYWRHGRIDLDLESVRRLLPSLMQLQHNPKCLWIASHVAVQDPTTIMADDEEVFHE